MLHFSQVIYIASFINPEEKKHNFHVIMIDQYTITRSERPYYYCLTANI